MSCVQKIKAELGRHADAKKAGELSRFFQAFPGGYGEGDRFLGVRVPDQRKMAKLFYKSAGLSCIERLLQDPVHEYRLTALFMLVNVFQADRTGDVQKEVVDLYLRNTQYVNNWDLVDSSAHKLLGAYLADKERDILYTLAASDSLWEQRIAVIATFDFIRRGDYRDALKLAALLLTHPHDLIHKAVGWMLREVGNRDPDTEIVFLQEHYRQMPRTMLRYAIEKFEPELRMRFLKGLV